MLARYYGTGCKLAKYQQNKTESGKCDDHTWRGLLALVKVHINSGSQSIYGVRYAFQINGKLS